MRTISLRKEFQSLAIKEKSQRYRELWHAAGSYTLLPDFPLHLDLELSGVCNLKCAHCFQSSLDHRRQGLMDPSLFRSIIDEAVPHGLCAIKLQVHGESFLHPDLFELVTYAKQQGVLDIQITTNGTFLDRDMINKILSSDLDGIIFSVDVRHKKAFTGLKTLKRYDTVNTAVNELLSLRTQRGAARPWVRLKASSPDGSAESLKALKASLAEEFPLADIHIVGQEFDYRKDHDSYPGLRDRFELLPCAYPMQRLAVLHDGRTTVCCMDYHTEFGLEPITSGVQNVWLSPRMQEFREAHRRGNRTDMPICRHCHACITPRNKNDFMDTTPRNMMDSNNAQSSDHGNQ